MSETKSDLITAVGGFITNLTPRSLVLGAVGTFIGLCLYSLYEARQVAFPYILNSPILLGGLGVATLLLVLTWATVMSVRRVEEMFEKRIADQQTRIDDQQKMIDVLRVDLDICRKDCREANSGMMKQILEKLDGP